MQDWNQSSTSTVSACRGRPGAAGERATGVVAGSPAARACTDAGPAPTAARSRGGRGLDAGVVLAVGIGEEAAGPAELVLDPRARVAELVLQLGVREAH